MDEKDLISKIRNNDEEAFAKFIDLYKNKIYSLCLSILKNEYDAEDAAQETFIKVYTSINKFKGKSSIYTWVYRIATNTCLDYPRKNKKTQIVSITEQEDDGKKTVEIPSHTHDPEKSIENKVLLDDIKNAIDKLQPDMKIAVILRDVHDIPYNEIAKITNSNIGTVKSRISRGRNILKKILSPSWEPSTKTSVKEMKGGTRNEV